MSNNFVRHGLQLRSLIHAGGELTLSLLPVELPLLAPGQVLLRVEAAPVNPSDIGLLLGTADMETLRNIGTAENPVVTARIPAAQMPSLKNRVNHSLPVGNEGAGVVVAAGENAEAMALVGKIVAVFGGAMYAQYRVADALQCLLLPEAVTPADGASCFVNPLTALCMIETLRLEGHTALVHTAAASTVGQMLNRICLQDGINLVNIVRSQSQEQLLRAMGAVHVCNSSAPDFLDRLTQAIATTNATLAFDATGGGKLAGQILACMETASNRAPGAYSRYGSNVHKQVYIYGGLDPGPTELHRSFGMSWSMGGWLFTQVMTKIGADNELRLRQRVAAEVTTTFASRYTRVLSLFEMLEPVNLVAMKKFATGEKYLINPNQHTYQADQVAARTITA